MRRAGWILAAAAALVVVAGAAVAWALRPPALPVPARQSWVFRDVTLVEPGRAARPESALRVEDGRIAALGTAGGAGVAKAPDLAGLFVAPGLVDMHVHYPPALAVGNAELWSLLFLAHGVTSVREMGSIDGSVFEVRRSIRAGAFPGPRLFACGAVLDGEPPSFPSNRVVRTAVEARAAVEEQASLGADCIKVYNGLGAEALAGVREAASRAGLPVVGHAPHAVPFERAGLVDLQHGTGFVAVDLARVGRLDYRAADWESMTGERIAYVARAARELGIAHTPTLWNIRVRRWLVPGESNAGRVASDTGLRHLPRFWLAVWRLVWGAPFAPGDAAAEAARERFRRRAAALTASLHAAGVRVHAGTDTLMPFVAPGSSLHGELAELARAGIPPEEVWRLATREAGLSLGAPGLGTLDPGAPADLLFLRADPRGDLSALARPEAVLADGRLYRRADLDAALARFDAHFHGRLYETAMAIAVRVVAARFAPRG